MIQIGDTTVDAYFQNIESIVTSLNALGPPMNNDDVCTYAINSLSDKFAHVSNIIAYRDPFSDHVTIQSMVITEELCLN